MKSEIEGETFTINSWLIQSYVTYRISIQDLKITKILFIKHSQLPASRACRFLRGRHV